MAATIATLEDWKTAAWLYDKVIPIQLLSYENNWVFPEKLFNWEMPNNAGMCGMDDYEEDHAKTIRRAIMPEWAYHSWENNPESPLRWSSFMDFMNQQVEKHTFDTFVKSGYEPPMSAWAAHIHGSAIRAWRTNERVEGVNANFREYFLSSLKTTGVVPCDFLTEHLPEIENRENTAEVQWPDFVSICLNGVGIIDTKELEWRHLLEIRKDKKAMARLRDLRILFHDNFQGKERHYVEDRVASLIDSYDEEIKRQGIKTKIGMVEGVLNSKTLLTGLGGAIAGFAIGQPIVSGLALGVASTIELGKLSLKVVRERMRMAELKESEVAYILRYRNQEGKPKS